MTRTHRGKYSHETQSVAPQTQPCIVFSRLSRLTGLFDPETRQNITIKKISQDKIFSIPNFKAKLAIPTDKYPTVLKMVWKIVSFGVDI